MQGQDVGKSYRHTLMESSWLVSCVKNNIKTIMTVNFQARPRFLDQESSERRLRVRPCFGLSLKFSKPCGRRVFCSSPLCLRPWLAGQESLFANSQNLSEGP